MTEDSAVNATIMVVDDSIFILKIIEDILKGLYNLELARSAEMALQLLETHIPDLILLELEIPKISGVGFLKKLKGNPKWKDIPVIFLTGIDDRHKEETAFGLGAVDYILKPISPVVLKQRIRTHLKLHRYQKNPKYLIDKKPRQLCQTTEAAKEVSLVKSAFLANMNNEIRTSMNNIIGFTDLALDDNLLPRTKDYLNKIKASSEALLQIIDNILALSKIEAGKMTLDQIPFDIGEVFESCQISMTPNALEKGIALFCSAQPLTGQKLIGDPTRLRQVLLNLLSNAVKFTPGGIVKLLSYVKESAENQVTVHFEIKDSGIGMSPEQIEKIFDPFVQADDIMTHKHGGCGLGLFIAQNMIELMGGKLKIASIPGNGSKFYFHLTFATIKANGKKSLPKSKDLKKPYFKGEVLVCEDNVLNQQVILDHLSKVGLSVTVTQNGQEGVEQVKQRLNQNRPPFNLIFMDMHMPVMDGLEAAKQLASIGNVSPIVALTANATPSDKKMYTQFNISDCLGKPFTTQELWHCLLKYINPVGTQAVADELQSQADKRLANQLLMNFWQDNQTTFQDITEALKSGNLKLAHRLAHTLKGAAGLIGQNALRKTAQKLESSLTDGKMEIVPEYLNRLEIELSALLNELSLKYSAQSGKTKKLNANAEQMVEVAKVLELLNKLEPILRVGNTDCFDLIEELQIIPGTEALISKIEYVDFISAHDILLGLIKTWAEKAHE